MITATQVDELQEYAELEGGEWGEVYLAMIALWRYGYLLPAELRKAISANLAENLEMIKEQCEIKEVEETETVTRKYKELVERE